MDQGNVATCTGGAAAGQQWIVGQHVATATSVCHSSHSTTGYLTEYATVPTEQEHALPQLAPRGTGTCTLLLGAYPDHVLKRQTIP
jgi:hypothetical protein